MNFDRRGVSRFFLVIVALIVLSRVGLAVVTAYFPVTNEIGNKASIHHPAPSSDLHHYQRLSKLYFDAGIVEVLKVVAVVNYDLDFTYDDYTKELVSVDHLEMSPPLFPALIWMFDYREGHTVPLALLFIGFSIAVAVAWVRWMEQLGVSPLWIVLFVFLPHPAWFTINLGSDLLFYCTFTIFFFTYYSNIERQKKFALAFLAMTLCVLTRPTGASLIVFFLVDQFLSTPPRDRKKYFFYLMLTLVAMSPAILFLFPYFLSVLNHTKLWPFFGITQPDYLDGIYSNLPLFLDLALSWLTLFASKFLYVFGLRPSYGDVSVLTFIFRSAPGLIFLPGFIHLMWRGTLSEKILLLSMLAPIFAGPAQDRYLLPVQPLLFYHAWLLMRPLHIRIANRISALVSP